MKQVNYLLSIAFILPHYSWQKIIMSNCCLFLKIFCINLKLKYFIKWYKALTKWVQITSLSLFLEIPKLQDELRSLNKSIHKELVRDYVNEAKGTLLLIQRDQLDKDKKMVWVKIRMTRIRGYLESCQYVLFCNSLLLYGCVLDGNESHGIWEEPNDVTKWTGQIFWRHL